MLHYEYVTYEETPACSYEHNLDIVTTSARPTYFFWYNQEVKTFKVSNVFIRECVENFNEDILYVADNLDMMLYEVSPLAVWFKDVGFGTIFSNVDGIKYKLAEGGFQRYEEEGCACLTIST